jgi:hypothetical protein
LGFNVVANILLPIGGVGFAVFPIVGVRCRTIIGRFVLSKSLTPYPSPKERGEV